MRFMLDKKNGPLHEQITQQILLGLMRRLKMTVYSKVYQNDFAKMMETDHQSLENQNMPDS